MMTFSSFPSPESMTYGFPYTNPTHETLGLLLQLRPWQGTLKPGLSPEYRWPVNVGKQQTTNVNTYTTHGKVGLAQHKMCRIDSICPDSWPHCRVETWESQTMDMNLSQMVYIEKQTKNWFRNYIWSLARWSSYLYSLLKLCLWLHFCTRIWCLVVDSVSSLLTSRVSPFPKLRDCSWEIEGHPFHGHVELVCRHLFGPQETIWNHTGGVKMTHPERSHWEVFLVSTWNRTKFSFLVYLSVVNFDLKPFDNVS